MAHSPTILDHVPVCRPGYAGRKKASHLTHRTHIKHPFVLSSEKNVPDVTESATHPFHPPLTLRVHDTETLGALPTQKSAQYTKYHTAHVRCLAHKIHDRVHSLKRRGALDGKSNLRGSCRPNRKLEAGSYLYLVDKNLRARNKLY